MGQAKRRGSYNERKAAAISAKREQERLDKWFLDREPAPKKHPSELLAYAVLVAGLTFQPWGSFK
ncbi:hypothetical protein [Neptunomonas sp. XY-337]|uniref:hypothetical protein n=1 Tax=Neptunomonas sp. XY-337 TaxID=2561897 RepID=UPI0010AA8F69|nr:hypothetical protein [Neptunomonas sp. XY-337]